MTAESKLQERQSLVIQALNVRKALFVIKSSLHEAKATKEDMRVVDRMIEDSEALEESLAWLARSNRESA
jgi:hypothetical protein